MLPPRPWRLLVPKPPPKPPPKLFPPWVTETELKLGRQPGRRFAEEALKFRVLPDLMVIDRWVMVGAGARGSKEQRCQSDEEPSESSFPKVSLTFIPFKKWAWPEKIKDHCVEFISMACLATAHLSALLIITGNTLPGAGPVLGIQAWGRTGSQDPCLPTHRLSATLCRYSHGFSSAPLFLILRSWTLNPSAS